MEPNHFPLRVRAIQVLVWGLEVYGRFHTTNKSPRKCIYIYICIVVYNLPSSHTPMPANALEPRSRRSFLADGAGPNRRQAAAASLAASLAPLAAPGAARAESMEEAAAAQAASRVSVGLTGGGIERFPIGKWSVDIDLNDVHRPQGPELKLTPILRLIRKIHIFTPSSGLPNFGSWKSAATEC